MWLLQATRGKQGLKMMNVWSSETFMQPKWVKHLKICLRVQFLGGLSLHLNHLIGSCMRISYGSFGTLPIGILFSNLDSGQLMTCPRTLFGQIWHMSIFGDSRAIWVLMPKYRGLRKSIFSRWRSNDCSTRLWGFRWADGWAIWWYYFWGGLRHLGALAGLPIRRFHF